MAIYFGQDIDTKYAQANIYFGVNSSIRTHDWSLITEDDRKAGLIEAERDVDGYLGTSLEINYSTTDWPVDACPNFRPDYAIFEQAIFILDNTARTRDGEDGAMDIESALYQEQERDTGVGFSPKAQRYLRLNRIQINRG